MILGVIGLSFVLCKLENYELQGDLVIIFGNFCANRIASWWVERIQWKDLKFDPKIGFLDSFPTSIHLKQVRLTVPSSKTSTICVI